MQLPRMSGLQVLNALHADDGTRRLPVVALSANAMPDEVEAARRAGAIDYLTKPLDISRFLARMLELLSIPK